MKNVFIKLFSLLIGLFLFPLICLSTDILPADRFKNIEIEDLVRSYELALKEKNYEKLINLFDDQNPEQ